MGQGLHRDFLPQVGEEVEDGSRQSRAEIQMEKPKSAEPKSESQLVTSTKGAGSRHWSQSVQWERPVSGR